MERDKEKKVKAGFRPEDDKRVDEPPRSGRGDGELRRCDGEALQMYEL